MSVQKRILRGGVSMMALRLYSMGLLLVLNGLLARWMTQEEFASYLVGSNLLILISLTGMSGLNQSMIRLISGRKRSDVPATTILRRCWITASVFSLLVTGVFAILLRTSMGRWLDCDPKIILSVLVCSLLVSAHRLLATSLRSVHSIAASGILEGRSGGPLSNTAFFPIVALLAMGGLNAPRTLWGFAIALAITLPVGIWLLQRALQADSRRQQTDGSDAVDGVETGNVWLFSLPFLLTQILVYFSTEFDVLLAKAYTDPESTALFGSARRLSLQAMAPMQILTASVASSIAELHAKGDRQGLQKLLRYSATAGSALTMPILLACVFFGGTLLALVLGEQYREGATIFAIFAVGQMANCLTGQCGNLLALSGQTTYLLRLQCCFAIALVVAGAWMAQKYGATGLAVSTTIVVALQNITMWISARWKLGYWTHPGLVWKQSGQKE